MPRKARIDAPGALHHGIIRGFEYRKIFRSGYDREYFITRLAELIPISITYMGCSAIIKEKPAKGKRYREFVVKGITEGRRPDLTGGGLLRSIGGWTALKGVHNAGIRVKGDERILGDSDFELIPKKA
jgi:hypothetical protein